MSSEGQVPALLVEVLRRPWTMGKISLLPCTDSSEQSDLHYFQEYVRPFSRARVAGARQNGFFSPQNQYQIHTDLRRFMRICPEQ